MGLYAELANLGAPRKSVPPKASIDENSTPTTEALAVTDVSPAKPRSMIEEIRKVVRQPGKEGSTYRLTPGEKSALAKIIYDFRQRGIRTSENEIARIAINYIIQDHKIQGKESILETMIASLNE